MIERGVILYPFKSFFENLLKILKFFVHYSLLKTLHLFAELNLEKQNIAFCLTVVHEKSRITTIAFEHKGVIYFCR